MLRWRVMREVAATTLREFIRTPEAVFWTYVFPVLMAVVLSMAFSERRPEPAAIAVIESSHALQWLAELGDNERLTAEVMTAEAAQQALARGRVDLVLDGAPATPVFLVDPVRPGSEVASLQVRDTLERNAGRANRLEVQMRSEQRVGSRYIDWLIPGLIGLNLLGAGAWGVGYTVADLRIKGLLRRLVVTPMGRSEYLLAFLFSRLGLGVLDGLAIVAFGVLAFGVPVHGSYWALAVVILACALVCSGFGLAMAARPRTTEGISGLINLCILPMWLMGGSFFSNERFPATVQPLVQAMPLTQINSALRAVMLDGASLVEVAPQLGYLLAFGAICFAFATKAFRWT